MKNLLSKIWGSAGLRQSLITVVGNTGATAISAVALILTSRLLGPTQFGYYSVGIAVIIILSRLIDAGLNATILKFAPTAKTPKETNYIFSRTLTIKIWIGTLVTILGLLITPWLNQVFRLEHTSVLYLAFGFSLITMWYEHLLTMLQSLHRFTQAVMVNAIQATSKLTSVLLLWMLGYAGPTSLFFCYVAAPAMPFLVVPWLVSKESLPNWNPKPKPEIDQVITGMAKHAAIGFIAAGLIENIDILFVQRYLTAYETGLLGGVSKVALMVLLTAYSLGNVLNPRVAKYKERAHLDSYVRKCFGIVALAVGGFICFVPFAKLSLIVTIGPEYIPGTPVLLILMAASFLTVATIPFLALFYTLKADWYFSLSGLIQLTIMIVGNLWLVPSIGLMGAAWTRLATRLFLFFFTVIVSLWLYRKEYLLDTQSNFEQT